ncbi:MAG: FUSC family protein [Burkholderiales bacterium]|nr:FUSC family protein [Burkholderiales bacterium]
MRAQDLRSLPWGDAVCGGIICAVPAILAALLHTPMLAWSAIAAFWTALSDPACSRSQRLQVALAFGLVGALAAGCGSAASGHAWQAVVLAAAAGCAGAYIQSANAVIGLPALLAATALAVATALPGHDRAHALAYAGYFLGGSLWAIAFRLLVWAAVAPTADADGGRLDWALACRQLRDNLHHGSRWFWHALRVGLASAMAVGVVALCGLDHGYWLILTTFLTMQPEFAATLKLSMRRVVGTLLGSLLAAGIGVCVQAPLPLALLILPLAVGTFMTRRRNYLLFLLFLTPQFVIVAHLAQPLDSELNLISVRIWNSFGGAVLSIVIASLAYWGQSSAMADLQRNPATRMVDESRGG